MHGPLGAIGTGVSGLLRAVGRVVLGVGQLVQKLLHLIGGGISRLLGGRG
jgi:hypothetical protein